ncbi:MAG: phage tail sheath subtilisin-like domain-containing protein [Ktedonobacteraceae bacterium]|nr:phage tail sheath subtilisin-like domain-containing protein [Ktedonobacteraceae bacterium]
MPEYLTPGVYVEEVSFRSKSIEGVSTTTTGFIGPTRYGPVDLEPDVITSVGEFERVYGDRQQLLFDPNGSPSQTHNYLWHAARAFFEEGGKRLYITRVFRPLSGEYPPDFSVPATKSGTIYNDGHARADLGSSVHIRARFPGAAGNIRVRFTLRIGQNILGESPVPGSPGTFKSSVAGLLDKDIVWINDLSSPIDSPPGSTGMLYQAERYPDPDTKGWSWRFHLYDRPSSPGSSPDPSEVRDLSELVFDPNPQHSDQVRIVSLAVTVIQDDGSTLVWDGLAFAPDHIRDGLPDSAMARFAPTLSNLEQARSYPIVLTRDSFLGGLDILQAIFPQPIIESLSDPTVSDIDRSVDVFLDGGNDGLRPGATDYEGAADPNKTTKTGLMAFEDIDDISIIAAPGSTYRYETDDYRSEANTILNLVIAHAARMRYRIAVLDSGDGQSIAQVRALRARFDSTYAALYYPWVRVLDPVTRQEIHLPPSGFVAGIYARNDRNRAVYKAPANEVVSLAIGFEQLLNKAQQEVLNPEGVNCFRFFEGRGFRLWGARTISSDPEWKYVNLRRYFAYLEHSIDRGTQWAVFEPNGEALWANVRRTIEDFLLNEWQNGALLGDKPEKAYFVRCDRSTMTQNDLDNGRLVCLIGVAPLRPAEFVIFRIGQWTADSKR